MTPVRLWCGVVVLALGTFGILGATGAFESSELIDRWWPVAIIALGLIFALAERRISIGSVIVMAIGSALLGDAQDWTNDEVISFALLVACGLGILLGRDSAGRREGRREGRCVSHGETGLRPSSWPQEHCSTPCG